MGYHPNIDHERFPRQGKHKDRPARVMFNYSQPEHVGTVIRDDMEDPFMTVIRLDDGRVVLGTECQYSVG